MSSVTNGEPSLEPPHPISRDPLVDSSETKVGFRQKHDKI